MRPTVMGRKPVKAASTYLLFLNFAKKYEMNSTNKNGGKHTAKVAITEPKSERPSGVKECI